MRKVLFTLVALFALAVGQIKAQDNMSTNNNGQAISQQELSDRAQLRALVDKYAVESDKGNQEAYRDIFVKNLNLKIYAGGNITQFNDVDSMIKVYKQSGKAKVSFHQTGQQYLDFQDATHATGVVYLTALLVDDKDVPTHIYIRYYDKYQKMDGRWWITDRDQHMLYVEH